eukprot:2449564-Lingulodinium_polyedra.AAC.1
MGRVQVARLTGQGFDVGGVCIFGIVVPRRAAPVSDSSFIVVARLLCVVASVFRARDSFQI